MIASGASQAALPATVRFEGTSGTERSLSDYAGKVLVLIHEDRDCAHQNDQLKRELAQRASTPKAKGVTLLPVADLHAYDFWPAKGFARKAVVEAAAKAGIEIFMDWQGSAARAFNLIPKQSQVLIFDSKGTVVFRGTGTLTDAERGRFFAALDAALGA